MIHVSTDREGQSYVVEFTNTYSFSSYLEFVKAKNTSQIVNYAKSNGLIVKKIYKIIEEVF